MTSLPPVQPPHRPSGQPAEANPSTTATQPLSAVPTTNVWRQATSTPGGRWALGIAAGAIACLMLLGLGVAGLLVLRNHDRVGMMLQPQDGYSRGNGDLDDQGNGRGPGARNRYPGMPGMPGAPGMRGGLGNLPGGTALHGNLTANLNGSVQALVFQRGEVTAVSGTSVALKSSDGFVGTYGLTAATRSAGAGLVKGGRAFVLARVSDKVAITAVSTPANTGQ